MAVPVPRPGRCTVMPVSLLCVLACVAVWVAVPCCGLVLPVNGPVASMATHITELTAGTEVKNLADVTSQASARYKQLNRTCEPGCYARGNCNAETGGCDCPFGFRGEWLREGVCAI